jgi:hypothetical protein
MCKLINLVEAVDSITEPLDRLYIVQFPGSSIVFLAFKDSDLGLLPLEVSEFS